MIRLSATRFLLLFVLAAGTTFLSAGELPTPVSTPGSPVRSRDISTAEREASQLVLRFFERGVPALLEGLSARSALRDLPPAEASAEILARTGPVEGSRWRLVTTASSGGKDQVVFHVLFPSGVDDFVTFQMVPEGQIYRLHFIRSATEPLPKESGAPPPPASGPAPPSEAKLRKSGLLIAAGALLIGAAGLLWRKPLFAVPPAIGGIACLAIAFLGFREASKFREGAGLSKEEIRARSSSRSISLGSLAETKRAICSAGVVTAPAAGTFKGPEAATAAVLFSQRLLLTENPARAREVLHSTPGAVEIPLTSLVRARLAALEGKDKDVALEYEKAWAQLQKPDSLAVEAASAMMIYTWDIAARAVLEEAINSGTRLAETYYDLARLRVFDEKPDEAARLFSLGWELEPLDRQWLLRDQVLWTILERPELYSKLGLSRAVQPVVTPEKLSATPLTVGFGVQTTVSGNWVKLRASSAHLEIPGGAALAPAGAVAAEAGAEERLSSLEAYDSLAQLRPLSRNAARLTELSVRQDLERILSRLAGRNRWQEILELTDGMRAENSILQPAILEYRSEALERAGQKQEARNNLLQLAQNRLFLQRGDAGALLRTSAALHRLNEYEQAVRLLEVAYKRYPHNSLVERIRRIRAESEVAASPRTYSAGTFDIQYGANDQPAAIVRFAEIFGRERARLRKWIPNDRGERIKVQILKFEEFRHAFSQEGFILGLFDGRIRLPLGGISRLHPLMVALMTHELTHALLDQASGGQAPKWFHEGLAQHLQMVGVKSNPLHTYKDSGKLLSLKALEPILTYFPSWQLVERSYETSEWVLFYIETKHGTAAIHRLTEQFKNGATTDDALQAALKMTVPEFDEAFQHWVTSEAPKTLTTPIVNYGYTW